MSELATFLAVTLAVSLDFILVGYVGAGILVRRYWQAIVVCVALAVIWRAIIAGMLPTASFSRTLVPQVVGALVFTSIVFGLKKLVTLGRSKPE